MLLLVLQMAHFSSVNPHKIFGSFVKWEAVTFNWVSSRNPQSHYTTETIGSAGFCTVVLFQNILIY